MKKTILLVLAAMLMLSMAACSQSGGKDDDAPALSSVLAQNILRDQTGTAIKVTDEDGSLSDYYNEKQVESIVTGYYDGKAMTIISGHDALWESDFVFYLYNGSAYSLYPKYDDDVLRYADFSGLGDLGDEYPASQFYFLEGWSPVITDTQDNGGVTSVVYEVTAQDDESYEYYFSEYDDILPGTKLYLKLELNADGKITAYSLSRDRACTDAVWARYAYTYVPLDDYDPAHIAELDAGYEEQELVTISLADSETGETTAEIKIQKGAPFYAEISAEQVLYLDRECTQPYLDYVLKYTQEGGSQLTYDGDAVLYIGAKK